MAPGGANGRDGAPGFGLYVHWPFCLAKCPYCDFNSHLRGTVDHPLWAESLVREMETLADRAGRRGVRLDSVFVGGGTPSLMEPATVAALLGAARSTFGFAPGIEITMEANPTSVEAGRLGAFRDAGVNRLSMGVPSLDDGARAARGRGHTAGAALRALATARSLYKRVSADFIYARPGQDAAGWGHELDRILALGLDHLSLYQLTLEPGTAYWSRHRRGLLEVPGDGAARELFDLTRGMCSDAGLPAYEVSNHAVPGAECRHNLVYWRAGDWIGVGPGAHGRYWLDSERIETRCRRDPDAWLAGVAEEGHGLDGVGREGPGEAAAEMLMMGLRLERGVDLGRLAGLPGIDGDGFDRTALDPLCGEGLATLEGERLRLTPKGIPLVNSVIGRLLAG